MKKLSCSNCGSGRLTEKNGYMVCEYCNSTFVMESSDVPRKSMGMSLDSDINMLLKKCRSDPRNARKYANLILDIDPGNTEVFRYL